MNRKVSVQKDAREIEKKTTPIVLVAGYSDYSDSDDEESDAETSNTSDLAKIKEDSNINHEANKSCGSASNSSKIKEDSNINHEVNKSRGSAINSAKIKEDSNINHVVNKSRGSASNSAKIKEDSNINHEVHKSRGSASNSAKIKEDFNINHEVNKSPGSASNSAKIKEDPNINHEVNKSPRSAANSAKIKRDSNINHEVNKSPAAVSPNGIKAEKPAEEQEDEEIPEEVNGQEFTKFNNSMEVKIADFFAEIESLNSENLNQIESKEPEETIAIDENPLENDKSEKTMPNEKVNDITSVHDSDNDTTASEIEDEDVSKEKITAPVSRWQYLLDDQTQCYYYWNTDSNEVTWEMPADYSQYLLKLKEHEEREIFQNIKSKTSKPKKDKKHKPKLANVTKSLVAYDSDEKETLDDTKIIENVKIKTSNRIQDSMYTNFIKSIESDIPKLEKVMSDCSSMSIPNVHKSEGVSIDSSMLPSKEMKRNDNSNLYPVEVRSVTEDQNLINDIDSKHPKTDIKTKLKHKKKSEKHKIKNQIDSTCKSNELPNVNPVTVVTESKDDPLISEKVFQNNNCKKTFPSLDDENSNEIFTANDKISKNDSSNIKNNFGHKSRDKKKYKYSSKRKRRHRSRSSSSSSSSSSSNSRHSKQISKHYEKKVDGDKYEIDLDNLEIEPDMDADDIDNVLETALRQKEAELKELENEDKRNHRKRSPSLEKFNSHHTKKKRKEALDESHTAEKSKFPYSKDHELKNDIATLTGTIKNKLEFLEVEYSGISKLQKLLIELECRLSDWTASALDPHYFYEKICDMNEQIHRYEAGAAPAGWTCHWDKICKRYFYHNTQNKKTQWDYPLDAMRPMSPRPPSHLPPEEINKRPDIFEEIDDVKDVLAEKTAGILRNISDHQKNPSSVDIPNSDEEMSCKSLQDGETQDSMDPYFRTSNGIPEVNNENYLNNESVDVDAESDEHLYKSEATFNSDRDNSKDYNDSNSSDKITFNNNNNNESPADTDDSKADEGFVSFADLPILEENPTQVFSTPDLSTPLALLSTESSIIPGLSYDAECETLSTDPCHPPSEETNSELMKEKKKRKDKEKKTSKGITMKKSFPSLVEKWTNVAAEIEKETHREKRRKDKLKHDSGKLIELEAEKEREANRKKKEKLKIETLQTL